jgi:glycosyltransferase involved in cell wall biosynthesis
MPLQNEEVYYDVTRLVDRLGATHPGGIDRVDLRYALWSRERAGRWIGIVQRAGGIEALPAAEGNALLNRLRNQWIESHENSNDLPVLGLQPRGWRAETLAAVLEKAARVSFAERLEGRGWRAAPVMLFPRLPSRCLTRRRNRAEGLETAGTKGVYWNIGHVYRFEKAGLEIHHNWGARSVVFLHDVIPLLHPETQREMSRRHFEAFFTWATALNGRILMSSEAAFEDLRTLTARQGGLTEEALQQVVVIPLAVEPTFLSSSDLGSSDPDGLSYFVIIGTWEPRKRFELLLDVWEQLRERHEQKIVLKWVGHRSKMPRGSRERFDRLQHAGWAEALGSPPDREMVRIMKGAQALLFPSQSEGWGLPLAEAMAAGVPAIASNRPVSRQVSQGLAEYVDLNSPIDWKTVIIDYARPESPLRAKQQERLRQFRAVTWEGHFQVLEEKLRGT